MFPWPQNALQGSSFILRHFKQEQEVLNNQGHNRRVEMTQCEWCRPTRMLHRDSTRSHFRVELQSMSQNALLLVVPGKRPPSLKCIITSMHLISKGGFSS